MRYLQVLIWVGIVTAVLWGAASSPVRADLVDNLYQARVMTDGQSSRDQRTAASNALAQVLVKVTGSRETLSLPPIKSQLRSARELLQSFRFDVTDGQLFYIGQFDPVKVDSLLRANQLAIWGARRPLTLVWMAEEQPDTHERILVSDSERNALANLIEDSADSRGIPVIYPLMDLSEREKISVIDVWGRFTDAVVAASERYASEGVLLARLYLREPQQDPLEQSSQALAREPEPGDNAPVLLPGQTQQQPWVVDWQYVIAGQLHQGIEQSYQRTEAVSVMVEKVSDLLASRFAISRNSGGMLNRTVLEIDGFSQFEDVVIAERLLTELAAVASVSLVSLQGDGAKFELQLFGDENNLTQLLNLERRVERAKDAFGQDRAELIYTWKG